MEKQAADGHTVIFTVKQERDVAEDEFIANWIGPHAEVVARIPRLRGYEILHTRDSLGAGEDAPDGFVILRFDSKEDADTALASPEMKAAGEDSAGWFSDFAAFHVDSYRIL